MGAIDNLEASIAEARKLGMTPVEMVANVEGRIAVAANMAASSACRRPTDYECKYLEKLFEEIRMLRDYRTRLFDLLYEQGTRSPTE